MDFKKYLEENAKKLDREIEKILEKNLHPITKDFISSCRGGKKIRGLLVKLGYELAMNHLRGGTKSLLGGEIIKIAAAYEIMHTAILIHDDIMDQSQKRRGQPSLYKKVGVSKAITLADYGFFLAIKIIAESKFSDKHKNNALKLFAQVIMDTAVGQIMDLEGLDKVTTAKLKTAQYTISGPLKLGAILAGANSDLLARLDNFGENLGIAYQIQDDIFDGEAMDNAKDKALEYTDKAKRLIPKITNNKEMVRILEEMVEYLAQRSK